MTVEQNAEVEGGFCQGKDLGTIWDWVEKREKWVQKEDRRSEDKKVDGFMRMPESTFWEEGYKKTWAAWRKMEPVHTRYPWKFKDHGVLFPATALCRRQGVNRRTSSFSPTRKWLIVCSKKCEISTYGKLGTTVEHVESINMNLTIFFPLGSCCIKITKQNALISYDVPESTLNKKSKSAFNIKTFCRISNGI